MSKEKEAPAIAEIARYMVTQLVDDKKSVQVTVAESERIVVLDVSVGKNDIGKVIGKKGSTVDAVRLYLNCIASKQNKRLTFQVDGRSKN